MFGAWGGGVVMLRVFARYTTRKSIEDLTVFIHQP
jgi:hypothetical protein